MMLKRFHIVFVFCLMALLSSCSHMSTKDGPPNFYVDASKIPNAVPRKEPLSKYGNMPVYRVKGKSYYPMKSSKNFTEVGIASWYGTKFHEQRTSSGEPYDMLAMTAAHKTLPLPTYVEVTNLKNNKKIIVKVNDRGPFKPSRIIDLSYVAAKKLGMTGKGTAPVRITAIDPTRFGVSDFFMASRKKLHSMFAKKEVKKIPLTTGELPTEDVYLQVGTFKNKVSAEKLRNKLDAMLTTPVNITRHSAKSKLYSVHIGPIKDMKTAKKISKTLKKLGMNSNKKRGA